MIPLLSFYMFLREMRDVPPATGPVTDRRLGVAVVGLALSIAALGNLVQIDDIVFYAMIVWIGGLVLTLFGTRRGIVFWPSVLHLVFMLPLPQFLYWRLNTCLQFVSSEIGVSFVGLMGVPVFLDGNIIDLGVYKLQVAEACSGLRYLFPIMSFTYVFAVLYRGPRWHKAVLLLSAVPLAVLMNSFRIGVIGVLVDRSRHRPGRGLPARLRGLGDLPRLHRAPVPDGQGDAAPVGRPPAARRGARPRLHRDRARARPRPRHPGLARAGRGRAPHRGALRRLGAAPRAPAEPAPRDPFALFPAELDGWSGTRATLDPKMEATLGADDYLSALWRNPAEAEPVDLFVSYYRSQTEGEAIHSPEVCLPATGWEVFRIRPVEVALPGTGFGTVELNRAIIQKGLEKQLVYYWFEGRGRRITNDFAAKFYTVADGMTRGRTDGGLVRLITPIGEGGEAAADARLQRFLLAGADRLNRFIPE